MWTKNIACLSGFTITIADLFFQQHGVLSSQHSRGYKFFVEGYIQDVRLHEVELVLKGKCHHSQKKNVKPHSLWFKFTTEPLSIIEAHCYCEVGLSQSCHHLVGLAYYLQDCVLRGHQELSDAPSSTSQAKQWNKSRGTKVIPESVLTTVFYNPTNTKRHKKPVMPRMQVPRVSRKEATHQETIKQFKQAIKQINNNAAMAYILDDSVDADDEMTTFQLHARVRAGTRQVQMPDSSRPFDLPIITSNTTNILIGQPLPPVEDMTLQQCIDLETRTRDQRSSEWHEARRFRFTSSSFGLLCKRKKDFSKEFFETLWSSSQQVQNVPAVQHGRKEETNAITLYMEENRGIK